MNEAKDFLEHRFKIPYTCYATVVNNVDSEDRGRLQVRIHEVISDSVKDADCPWAEIKGVLFASDNSTVGVSSVPKIGTMVYVDFLYHNPSYPMVTGIVRGNKDSSKLFTKNLSGTIYDTRNSNKIGPELSPLNNATTYPLNNVIETDTAVIEIDDTPTNERIAIQHKNGSYYEIRPNGDIQIKTSNNMVSISKGDLEIYSGGNVKITAEGTVSINGSQIYLNS